MTSSVRLPLATTVCGGSTYKLFRPLAGESPADCRRSAEISRELVQRIDPADSEGCSGITRSRGGVDFPFIGRAAFAHVELHTESQLLCMTVVVVSAVSSALCQFTSPPASVDTLFTADKLPVPGNTPKTRMRDTHRHPVSSSPKFISRLRLTTRPVSVASPPLSVCFRTRLHRCCPPSVQQSLHTGFPAPWPDSQAQQVGCCPVGSLTIRHHSGRGDTTGCGWCFAV